MSLCRSITCIRWGWIISSLYLTAVKLPGTCTMAVLWSFEIATHTMTLPPPKLSTSWTQKEEKRSFRLLYTRILPSRCYSRKRDSSLNQILRQCWNVQPLNLLHQRPSGSNVILSKPVCELILRNSGIQTAVVDAATVRFRRWKTRMYRSCPGVAMRSFV